MKTIKQQIEKKEKEIKVLKEKLENESLKSFRCKELNLEITPLKEWTKPYNEIVIPKGWRLLKTHEYFYLIEEGYENQLIGKFKNEYNYAWTQQTNYAKKNNYASRVFLYGDAEVSSGYGDLQNSNDYGRVAFCRKLDALKTEEVTK